MRRVDCDMITASRSPLLVWVALAASSAMAQTPPAPTPTLPADVIDAAHLGDDAPKATLVSGGLRVTIALPDAQRGFYRSTRFDWSGMITEVTMNHARFYGKWFDGLSDSVHDFLDSDHGVIVSPRNAATGPAEEFANRDGETVPGYNAAPAGGTFIKIGVGRLRKDDLRPYDHFNAYTIVDGGTWTIRRTRTRITFIQRLAPDGGGYGYEYEKSIRLAPGGLMTIAHRLRNIGSNPIHTQIYNHNLARFDNAAIGPGIAVQFPFAVTGAVSNPALAAVDHDVLRYIAPLMQGDRVQLPAQPGDPTAPPGPFRVTGANGASVTMQSDTPLVRTAFWSIRHAVAVEPFVAINTEPGARPQRTNRMAGHDQTAGQRISSEMTP